jgi:glycosyltransferase involved in cell wall biosynthesis
MQAELSVKTSTEINNSIPWSKQRVSSGLVKTKTRLVSKRGSSGQPRVLHCVGHLLRGGIEMGLFRLLTFHSEDSHNHHILVRTAEEEAFTGAFRDAGMPVLSCVNFRNPFRYAVELRRLIRAHGPYDILHVHGSSFSGLLTLLLAKWCGIPWTIVHSHNDVRPTLSELSLLERAYIWLVLALYREFADAGFASSNRAAESMFGMEWKADPRWELLFYGIDCDAFKISKDCQLRATCGIEASALVIGHVGRFHEQKNHAFLVDMVQAAVAINPRVVCLCVGDGPLRESVAADINLRGLHAHFVFLPDYLDIPTLMLSVMDCFVFPSRYEGLGLVVVEAQAAGLPCLISDRIPAEATIDQSLVTSLALETSPDEWAATALNLMVNRHIDQSGAGIQRIEASRFNLGSCASAVWERYAEFSR